VLRAAERKNVPVNFAQLFTDLEYWGDRVKVQWAAQYWSAPVEKETAGAEEEVVTDEDEAEQEEEEA
jgi:hypothetical protein